MRDATAGPARLERARKYLAIAEAGDARREAYREAAEEIAAHKAETGQANGTIAEVLQRTEQHIARLLRWRANGCKEETPWRYEGKDDRAADAHARRVLRERPEVIHDALREQPAEQRAALAAELITEDARVADAVIAHRPETAGHLMGALDRQHPPREREPEPVDRVKLLVQLRYVHRKLAEVLGELRAAPVIPEDVRDNLRGEVAWLRNALDLLETAVEGGDWDAGLAELLAGEAS